MTDFATGVQRWCSCLDCVLEPRTHSCGHRCRLLLARALIGLRRVLSDSHKVRFKCGRATALQPQRFRSADMTAKHSTVAEMIFCSLEGKQGMDVIADYRHAMLSHKCLARELSI